MRYTVVSERNPNAGEVAVFDSNWLDESLLVDQLKKRNVLPKTVALDDLRIKEYDTDCWSVMNADESLSFLVYPHVKQPGAW